MAPLSIGERARAFAASDEPVIAAFRAVQGPRPGTEALALAAAVPVLAFSPAGIGTALLLCAAVGVVALCVITALRRSVIVAVTEHTLLVLDCGRVPGRWEPRSLLGQSDRQPLVDAAHESGRRGLHLDINGCATWVVGGDQDEARRLATSMADPS